MCYFVPFPQQNVDANLKEDRFNHIEVIRKYFLEQLQVKAISYVVLKEKGAVFCGGFPNSASECKLPLLEHNQ